MNTLHIPIAILMYTGLLIKAFRVFKRMKLEKFTSKINKIFNGNGILFTPSKGSKLGVVSTKRPKVIDVLRVSDEKQLSFILERGHLYVKMLSLGSAWHLSNFFVGDCNLDVIPDRHLQYRVIF